jgi:hypothetical protein
LLRRREASFEVAALGVARRAGEGRAVRRGGLVVAFESPARLSSTTGEGTIRASSL